MAQIATDPVTGGKQIFDEQSGRWVPFADAESGLDAALIVAGGALNQIGRGVKNLLNLEDRGALQEKQQEQDQTLRLLREHRPVASFIGDALPGLATLPIGGTALLAGRLSTGAAVALSTGLGAIEGNLRLDAQSESQLGSTLQGAIGGLIGEGVGRGAGRVANAIAGIGSSLARNPAASKLAAQGLETLPSERLNVPGQNIVPLQRLEQGAQTGVFTPAVFERISSQRKGLMNTRAGRSVGLEDLDTADGLTPDVLATAQDSISDGFSELATSATKDGLPRIFAFSTDSARALANRLQTTKGQLPELIARGEMFQGLKGSTPQLQGNEILIARRALAQDAAERAGKGQHELASAIYRDVELIDQLFADTIGDPGAIARHANLREQYRNLQILMGPGVINDAGDVVPKTLNRRLGQSTGYGSQYKQGRSGAIEGQQYAQGTMDMFEAARTLSDPTLQPFKSSGTAENQAIRDLGTAVTAAAVDPVAGGLGLATRLAAPTALSLLGGTNRAANVAGGLLLPGGNIAGRLGSEAAPSIVDQLLAEQIQGQQLQ